MVADVLSSFVKFPFGLRERRFLKVSTMESGSRGPCPNPVADLGERPAPPFFGGGLKKKESTEGRKADRASKTPPPPV